MATGDSMLAKCRRMLRDVTSAVQKGEYWRDAEIFVAINAAQDTVFDLLLKKKAKHMLQKLVRTQTTALVAQNAGLYSAGLPDGTPDPLYAHWLSVMINGEVGRIYDGGRGVQYLDVRHNGVAILGNNWYLMSRTAAVTGDVLLHYYTYPTAIAAGATTLTDFEDAVYDVIANLATAILGQKEIHRGRDISKMKTVAQVAMAEPSTGVFYQPITPYLNEPPRRNAAAQDAS